MRRLVLRLMGRRFRDGLTFYIVDSHIVPLHGIDIIAINNQIIDFRWVRGHISRYGSKQEV